VTSRPRRRGPFAAAAPFAFDNIPPEPAPLRRELDNGTVLLSRPTPDAFGVSIGVMVRSGTRDEAAGEGGISHLLEHMVFKGTASRSAFELARDMEALGAQLDAYTTKEHTGYTLKAMPGSLDEASSILAEMLLASTYPDDQLELEKAVVLEEILSSEDTPDDHVHELFSARLLGDHPLGPPILGTRASVESISRDALRAHADRVHRGGNILLVVTGAIDDAVLDTVVSNLAFAPGPAVRGPRGPVVSRPGVECHPKDLSQDYVEIGIPTDGMGGPDRHGLLLVSNILGGGMSSRLFQSVREDHGLAYSIYSYVDFHHDAGMLCTSLSSSPEHTQPALDLVAAEYERLRRGEVSEAELEMNRAQLIGSVLLGLEGSMNQMSRLARGELYLGRFVPVEDIVADIRRVTRDDVVRLAEATLAPALQTVVGYGPTASLSFGA